MDSARCWTQRAAWVTAVAGAAWGCLPPDKPTTPTVFEAPVESEAEAGPLTKTWLIEEHVMVRGASIDEADAIGFHGRTVVISGGGYVSPWQGTCEQASRDKTTRKLEALVAELAVETTDRPRVAAYGLGPFVTEFRLSCADRRKPPPLLVYLGNDRAMTCFGGACYLMKPF